MTLEAMSGSRVNRSRHISQRIELLVCGHQVSGLAGNGAPNLTHNGEALLVNGGGKARNGLELVERTASVPKATPAHLGNAHAKRRHDRRHHQVVLSPTPPVECLSTLMPGMGERSTMSPGRHAMSGESHDHFVGHALVEDGHAECRRPGNPECHHASR